MSATIAYSGLSLPERDQPLIFHKLDKAVRAAIKATLDRAPGIPSSAKRIWLYFAGLVGRHRDYAYPHHSTIADKLGISRKTVQRALKQLTDTGWLKYEAGSGMRGNKMWLLLPDRPQAQADEMTCFAGENDQVSKTECPAEYKNPSEPLIEPATQHVAVEPAAKEKLLELGQLQELVTDTISPTGKERIRKAAQRFGFTLSQLRSAFQQHGSLSKAGGLILFAEQWREYVPNHTVLAPTPPADPGICAYCRNTGRESFQFCQCELGRQMEAHVAELSDLQDVNRRGVMPCDR